MNRSELEAYVVSKYLNRALESMVNALVEYKEEATKKPAKKKQRRK